MTDKRRLEIEAEAAQYYANRAVSRGGVLEAGKTVKMGNDESERYAAVCKEAEQFKDKNGKVDQIVQAIYARMFGLI